MKARNEEADKNGKNKSHRRGTAEEQQVNSRGKQGNRRRT